MTPPQTSTTSGILGISLRTATVLLLFTLVFTSLMAIIHSATRAPIAASVEAEKLKLIGEVLPAEVYDNDLLKDAVELPATPALGLDRATHVYRARKAGLPAALVFEAAAPDGYSGRIGLILATRMDGELLAVRVVEHKETPGLGDYIDLHKDKNKTRPWIRQFDRQSFARLPAERWRVKKDGGEFEQRSGATISARAVTNAVARAMTWAAIHQREMFGSTPASSSASATGQQQ